MKTAAYVNRGRQLARKWKCLDLEVYEAYLRAGPHTDWRWKIDLVRKLQSGTTVTRASKELARAPATCSTFLSRLEGLRFKKDAGLVGWRPPEPPPVPDVPLLLINHGGRWSLRLNERCSAVT